MDKATISNLAEECGCRVPKSEIVKKGEIPQNLRYPIITKSISSTTGAWKRDSRICSSPEELLENYKTIKSTTLLIEEFVVKKNELCIDGFSFNNGCDVFIPYQTTAQETYTCFQYGIGNHVAVGTDIYTGVGSSYWGFLVRYGAKISPWFGIGGQVTPSFNLNDSFKYSYTTSAVYMNGQITSDGKLFWCSNTWLGFNKDADDTYTNWEYLGYTFSLKNGHSVTPMVGAIHSWKFDQDVDMAAGLYYSIKNWNIYLWGSDFFKDDPRLVVGIDFAL